MDLTALIEGTPQAECSCSEDSAVHYHADLLIVLTILCAEQWRMRPLKLLSPPDAVCRVIGADDYFDWCLLGESEEEEEEEKG